MGWWAARQRWNEYQTRNCPDCGHPVMRHQHLVGCITKQPIYSKSGVYQYDIQRTCCLNEWTTLCEWFEEKYQKEQGNG